MRNETRTQYEAYLSQIAKLSGITDPTKTFTVAPPSSRSWNPACRNPVSF